MTLTSKLSSIVFFGSCLASGLLWATLTVVTGESPAIDGVAWVASTVFISLLATVAAAFVVQVYVVRPLWSLRTWAAEPASAARSVESDELQTPVGLDLDDTEPATPHLQTSRLSSEFAAVFEALQGLEQRAAYASQNVAAENASRTILFSEMRRADRSDAVGRLATSVAHNVGTSLAVVMGRLQLVRSSDDPGQILSNLEAANTKVADIQRTVERLLDLAGASPVNKQVLLASDVLYHAAQLMAPVSKKDASSIEIGECEQRTLFGDSKMVVQALTNMIVAALQRLPATAQLVLATSKRVVDVPPEPESEPGCYDVISLQVGSMRAIRDSTHPDPLGPSATPGSFGLEVCHQVARRHGGFFASEHAPTGRSLRYELVLPAIPTTRAAAADDVVLKGDQQP